MFELAAVHRYIYELNPFGTERQRKIIERWHFGGRTGILQKRAIENKLATVGIGDHVDWSTQSQKELLRTYASLMEELRARGICRSSNNPVADYTEGLVASRLGLHLSNNSTAGYDATDAAGLRYQIKGRRLTPHNQSTQLSALRNLTSKPFDWLAAVIYNSDFTVAYGGLIPCSVVLQHAVFRPHVNAHIFLMRRSVLALPGVADISAKLVT